MSDIVERLLFRSSDEDGIGWTPNTVVHVPSGLLHEAADEITALHSEVERLRAALEEIANENIGNTAAIAVFIARDALEKK